MRSTESRNVKPAASPHCHIRGPLSILVCTCIIAAIASGCDDPSNVGLGLIGDQGGVPFQRAIESTEMQTDHFRYITGGTVGPFGEEVTALLVGVVDDPQLGRTTAHGHANVQQAPFLPDNFRESPVTAANVVVRRHYLYGDSASTIQVRLRALTASWTPTGARADTSLSVGDAITTFEFRASDTLVTVPMPEEWIEANNALLRESTETFNDQFHGFQFEALSGNAVAGFSPSLLDLQVINQTDTTIFPGTKVFSRIEHDDTRNLPPGSLPLQAGVGTTLNIDFDMGQLELAALNRAVLHVQPDSAAWALGVPETFHRPFPNRLSLFGVTRDRGELLLQTVDYDITARRYSFSGDTFARVMRDVIVGNDELHRFILRIPGSPLTINSILIFDETDPERAPRLTITAVPVD